MAVFKQILKRVYNRVYPEIPFPENKRSVMSYSQNGEDLIADAILGSKKTGVYVDIGANDPVNLSNTYRFYRRGWTGICIEPNPDKAKEIYNCRPNDVILNCGVSDCPGDATFYILNHDTVSTFDLKTAKSTNLERGTTIVHSVVMPLKRLDTLFDKYLRGYQIDLMSIDVEGYEINVLKSNDWIKYRPKVLIIEINNNTQEILDYLYTQKYVPIMRNAENGIFITT